MIISASRRTDIPRYYAEWFMNRVRAGYCLVPNPFNVKQVSRVMLSPDAVTAFVFWTRYPAPLAPFLPELDQAGYRYYFTFTLTNYPQPYEPNAPPLEQTLHSFQELSQSIGPGRMVWRYDPILFADDLDERFHLQNFSRLCSDLQGHTHKVVISLLDEYRKTVLGLRDAGCKYRGNPEYYPDLEDILARLADIAGEHGMEMESCAENHDWMELGIRPGRCIDVRLLNRELGLNLTYQKDPHQRPVCGCMVSKDIGMNHSCLNGCVYCYATNSHENAVHNHASHRPDSPCLIGVRHYVEKDMQPESFQQKGDDRIGRQLDLFH